jgi:hypothetical protein
MVSNVLLRDREFKKLRMFFSGYTQPPERCLIHYNYIYYLFLSFHNVYDLNREDAPWRQGQ